MDHHLLRQRSFDVSDLQHHPPPPPPLVSQLSLQSNTSKSNRSSKKQLALKIILLDDSVTIIQAQSKAPGRLIFDQICKQLNVLESDYFGLEYINSDNSPQSYYWLDLDKQLSHQLGFSLIDPCLRFSVKFYTPDPSQLEEEFTRYLYSLQIRRDLANGDLICNDNTAALMASYLVQAECGDFNEDDYPDPSYLRSHQFIPNQDTSIEYRIRENHKKHIGQSPGEADLHLLETARRTEFYGIRMWSVKDDDSVQLNLAVCHSGILVFQNYTKINTFSWGKIRKLSFKRKKFILKLHPEGFGYYKELVEFLFTTRNECKAFWKSCVEHHSFFRCEQSTNESTKRTKSLLSARGSSFRYSGRTQKQMVNFVRENFIKRSIGGGGQHQIVQANVVSVQGTPTNSSLFQRSSSFRSTGTGTNTTTPVLHHHPLQLQSGVSTSCSSPAVVDQQYNNQRGGQRRRPTSPGSTDSFSPTGGEEDTSINSSPQLHYPPPGPPTGSLIQQPTILYGGGGYYGYQYNHHHGDNNQQALPSQPDWFYYALREFVQTTCSYLVELQLLCQSVPHDNSIANLVTSNKALLTKLELNNSSIKKELWDGDKNGVYSLNSILKYYERNGDVYKNYLSGLKLSDSESHLHMATPALQMRPVYRVIYVYGDWLGVFVKNTSPTPLKPSQQHNNNNQSPRSSIMTIVQKLIKVLDPISQLASSLQSKLESEAKIIELRRELPGSCQRETGVFIRQGLLLKTSSNQQGLVSRMVWLFSTSLYYGSRISSQSGFRLHGSLKIQDCSLEEGDGQNSFQIRIENGGEEQKLLILTCPNLVDKEGWVEDFNYAKSICCATNQIGDSKNEKSLVMATTTTTPLLSTTLLLSTTTTTLSLATAAVNHRSNSTLHVSWHRSLSYNHTNYCECLKYNLSGYLLRKFKNSPGWQRLFVTFSNVCLYFYKTHEDTNPLASLPLLGYSVELDEQEKKHVFKLCYKSHVYYFRGESPFTYLRWVGTLKAATRI